MYFYEVHDPTGGTSCAVALHRKYLIATRHGIESCVAGDVITVQIEGDPVGLRVMDISEASDLVLLYLPAGSTVTPPPTGTGAVGADWFTPWRPHDGLPVLTGTIDARHDADLTAGGKVGVLQLTVRQDLGGYEGYSGGPVQSPVGPEGCLVGVISAAVSERVPLEAPRDAPVLFAVSLETVLQAFDVFDLSQVIVPVEVSPRDRILQWSGGGRGGQQLIRAAERMFKETADYLDSCGPNADHAAAGLVDVYHSVTDHVIKKSYEIGLDDD